MCVRLLEVCVFTVYNSSSFKVLILSNLDEWDKSMVLMSSENGTQSWPHHVSGPSTVDSFFGWLATEPQVFRCYWSSPYQKPIHAHSAECRNCYLLFLFISLTYFCHSKYIFTYNPLLRIYLFQSLWNELIYITQRYSSANYQLWLSCHNIHIKLTNEIM